MAAAHLPIFDDQITCARYSRKIMGIGHPGESAFMFASTAGLGRDLDNDDVAILHRFVYLWNAARGLTNEQAIDVLQKAAKKLPNKLPA